MINDVFTNWEVDENSGKEMRLGCYGDRRDPIPAMFAIRNSALVAGRQRSRAWL